MNDLPMESTDQAQGKGIRGLLVILLTMFVLANTWIWFLFNPRPINRGHWIVQEKWRMLRELEAPVDWLIVGDSSCGHGIDPRIVESRLGGRAINLCTVGSMIALEGAWMIEVYLERFGNPRGIIVGHAYDVWSRTDRELRGALWLANSRASFWNGLSPSAALDLDESLSLWISPWIPLYSQARSVEELIVSRGQVLKRENFVIEPGGLTPAAGPDAAGVRRDSRLHLARVEGQVPSISKANDAALDAMVRSSRFGPTPIWLVNAPLHEGLWSEAEFRRYFGILQDELADRIAGEEHASLLLVEPLLFPAARMQNSDHVAPEAVSDYSVAIVEAMLASRAWRKLR